MEANDMIRKQAWNVLLVVWVGTSASFANAQSTTYYGPSMPLGQGKVRAMVVANQQGKPVSLGFSISKTALSGLPAGPEPSEVMLTLPVEVSVPPFTHLTLDWNPKGHEPPKIYDAPHFDFHFYLIPPGDRQGITASDGPRFAKAPAANQLPKDYVPTPGGVPGMGAHWVDATSPEFNGKPFTTTFIYGTYDGSVIFYEPMITLAFLSTAQDFSAPVKRAPVVERKGYVPGLYRVSFSKQEDAYQVLLDELTAQ